MTLTKKTSFLFSIVLILALIVFSTGCATDLGTFSEDNDYEEYYDSFGSVDGLFEVETVGQYEPVKLSYSIKDSLLNDETVNEMDWEDEDDAVKSKEYVYIILPFETAMKLESVALFIKSEIDCEVHINAFYFINEDAAPKKIKYRHSPDTETIIVDDQPQEVEIVYDDPVPTDSISGATVSLVKDEWNSFILSDFRQEGYDDGNLHTGDNGLLYIRIENNSGHNVSSMPSCPITFINLLVRKL